MNPIRKARPDAREFRAVIGHFASGVTVIATLCEGVSFGTTASAVCSLSVDPPMVLICMNLQSSTGIAIETTKVYSINILDESQIGLAEHVARSDTDKFASVRCCNGTSGQPLLDNVLAHLECKVTNTVPGGTHREFFAEVLSAEARGDMPLAYCRGKFGRLTFDEFPRSLKTAGTYKDHVS